LFRINFILFHFIQLDLLFNWCQHVQWHAACVGLSAHETNFFCDTTPLFAPPLRRFVPLNMLAGARILQGFSMILLKVSQVEILVKIFAS
jgi:hypothetical protein